ncbi:MAG: PAS domain-containing sensor histidine kinase [Chloroflexi bacterium]|nr:PAS domain-containing sensor histidine kinase [Chloroflexota bacterium]
MEIFTRGKTKVHASETIEAFTDGCRAFADALSDEVLIIDPQFQVLFANEALLRNKGWTAEEVIGRHCYEVSHRKSEPCFPLHGDCPMQKTITSGSSARATHVHFGREGRESHVDVVTSGIKNECGRVVGVVEIVRDITHRVELEQALSSRNEELGRYAQELEDARRRRNEFASAVSHELNNVLTVLNGYAQLLGKWDTQTWSAGELCKIVNTITGQSNRLKRLIKDLGDISSMESGRFDLKRGRCDVVEIAREVTQARQSLTEKHRLVFEGAEPGVNGHWDCDRIRQVIDNVVDNAVKYSPQGGQVRVRVARQGNDVSIAVSDQGLGISQEELPHLFRPYARAHKEIKGLGLGLSICKGIVEAHGGCITVESEEGRGTTFRFTLPIDPMT